MFLCDRGEEYIACNFSRLWKMRAPDKVHTCQHGKNECIGNMIHACATLHVKDSSKLVKYISCMIQNNREPKKVGESCAKSLEIEWEPIGKCSDTTEGVLFCLLLIRYKYVHVFLT